MNCDHKILRNSVWIHDNILENLTKFFIDRKLRQVISYAETKPSNCCTNNYVEFILHFANGSPNKDSLFVRKTETSWRSQLQANLLVFFVVSKQ